MSCVKLPSAVLLLVLSGLYLISLGCGGSLPGNVPLPAPSNGTAGAASVSISPQTAALSAGNSLQFTATSSELPSADLEWLANGVPGGNSASGTISRSGLYTAPQQVTSNAVIVVAVSSKTEPTKASSATVTVLSGPAPIGAVAVLSITPTSASVPTAGMQLFTASVTGTSNTAVTWGLSGAGCSGSSCGTLSTSSLSASAVYLAPSVAPTPASVDVIATSVVDPTKSASANLIVVPAVVVGVTPASVSITAGITQQFAASVTGTSNTAVAWTVSGTGCSGTACGRISSNGIYTAPTAVPSSATVAITATSVADPTKSASAAVTIVPPAGTTYYLAPAAAGGNDYNNGLSPSAPWLSPNHYVNCGDVIIAAPSTSYSYVNFQTFGTVTCSAGNNVAWLKCATFDGCKISFSASLRVGIQVGASYWGVQGWEVDGTSATGNCFYAAPSTTANIHHVIFANDIANGCGLSGFGSSVESGNYGVDYVVVLGTIAYANSGGSVNCSSGISIYEPVASDTLPGTHIYVAGNFGWLNVNGNPCAGGAPSDGEGLILDTLDGDQTSMPIPYRGQVVADNNIFVSNGGRGLTAVGNWEGTAPYSNVYLRHNTLWGNNTDTNQTQTYCGELLLSYVRTTEAYLNIAEPTSATGCGANTLYVFYVGGSYSTALLYNNFGYRASSQNIGTNNNTGFVAGPNNTFSNPSFANAVAPGAPSCGSATSVPNCMATVIANFTPTNAAAVGYGYQIPSSTSVYDPLFPQWLCKVNLPTGLISMGCKAGP
jgi:hypothetical protein